MNDHNDPWDSLWVDVHLATMEPDGGYGEIKNGAIAVRDGRIAWVGEQAALPHGHEARHIHLGEGRWLTPGLIDCHTHIIHAGNRSDEFEARLNGVPYEQIARHGGGIMSSVRATRSTDMAGLIKAATPRIKSLLAEGVTTIEIKSGYGLQFLAEANMLRAARALGTLLPINVRTSFLGAHALPPEFAERPNDYLTAVCEEMLPALHEQGLVDAVDAFCETIAFSPAQVTRLFDKAQALGLPVKLHAEQLSNQGGAQLVAHYGGLSADHLEWLSEDGARAMAKAGTVAVMLPGAFYFLRETHMPPVQLLRDLGVRMAVATDCNPGTSPMPSMLAAMNLACTLFRMTPVEALVGSTRHAAAALGLSDELGTLTVGKRADFALWNIDRPADLPYALGFNPCTGVVNAGVLRRPHVH